MSLKLAYFLSIHLVNTPYQHPHLITTYIHYLILPISQPRHLTHPINITIGTGVSMQLIAAKAALAALTHQISTSDMDTDAATEQPTTSRGLGTSNANDLICNLV